MSTTIHWIYATSYCKCCNCNADILIDDKIAVWEPFGRIYCEDCMTKAFEELKVLFQ